MKKILMTLVLAPVMAMALELSPSFAPEAVTAYKIMAEAGKAEAQFLYAWALSMGSAPGKHNPAVAFDNAKKSAEQGFELAYRLVGLGFEEGWNGSSNAVEAAAWYGKFFAWAKPAAEKGNAWAQLQLGQCYESGSGIEKDPKEAVQWYRKAAEKGCAIAQAKLSECYGLGKGVEKDEEEMQKWERKAAEQGDIVSQVNLGIAYGNGYYGERDPVEAVKWYRKAAEQGFDHAVCLMGLCHRRGIGVATNHAEAVKWYRKAAKDRGAQYRLWLYYANGDGVKKNLTEAVNWYCKFATNDWQPLGDPRKTDELYAHLIGEKSQADNLQKVYDSLVALGKGLKDCPDEIKAHYEKDLSFVKGKLEQEKKGSLRGRLRALRKPKAEEPALTEVIEGSTWSYRVCKGAATICSVSPKPAGSISVPAVLGGLPVTAIGERAFIKCEGLTSVMIPSSVSNIGRFAFYDCRGLTTLTIPSGVTSIEDGAFAKCANLRSVSIPSTVKKIDPSSFSPCNALMSFDVSPENPIYSSADGLLYSKDGKTVVAGLYGKMEIPLGVTTIGHAAFLQREGLNEVTIPSTVTSIGPWAFSGCTNLTSISFPLCVTNIGLSAFAGRNKLTTVTIPTSLTNIVKSAFKQDGAIVASSNGMTTVVFNRPKDDRKVLTEEKIRELKAKKIAASYMSGKSGNTEKVGNYTWSYRVNNGEAEIVSEKSGMYSCAVSPKPRGRLEIPSVLGGTKVTSIRRNAFYGCRGLTSVTIPDGVTSIGGSAFFNCYGLTSVTIPDGVTNIGVSAFSHCSALRSVTIPSSVTSIGSASFYNCCKMLEFVVNEANPAYCSIDGVLYNKDRTSLIQYPCAKAGTFTIPDGVRYIGKSAFSCCGCLTSVTIPDGVMSIGDSAFSDCAGLKSVTIPSSVTGIGSYSFCRCYGISAFVVKEANPAYCSIDGVLYNKDRTSLIQYPCAKAGTLTIPDGVTSIGKSAFSDCSGLMSVTIPEGVTSIDDFAFYECSGLTTVTIPSSVVNIGKAAFDWCARIKSFRVSAENPEFAPSNGLLCSENGKTLVSGVNGNVVIPDSVTKIVALAFSGRSELTAVTIPASVTEIGTEAFRCCRGLTSVTFCGERPNAGKNIFSQCDKLKSIHVPANSKSWAGMKEWQGIPLVFDAE